MQPCFGKFQAFFVDVSSRSMQFIIYDVMTPLKENRIQDPKLSLV